MRPTNTSKSSVVPDAATMPKTADVVVIGGGIVGVATAFWLSRAGLDTVLVEMREGLSTLTTPLSIESFRAQMTEKALADLVLPSIRMYENFADTVGIPGHDIALKHQGYLFVSDDASMAEKLKQAVATVTALEWFDDLAAAKARSAATGKPILWLQSLGDLEGFA